MDFEKSIIFKFKLLFPIKDTLDASFKELLLLLLKLFFVDLFELFVTFAERRTSFEEKFWGLPYGPGAEVGDIFEK